MEEALELWAEYLKLFPDEDKRNIAAILHLRGFEEGTNLLRKAIKQKKRILFTDDDDIEGQSCYI